MSSVAVSPRGRWPSLQHRDFRLLLAATVMANLIMPMQFISLTFWSIDNYPGQKVLFSSLIVGVRGAGMLLFSLFGGAIADRFERRKVLLICESISFTVTLLTAVCMLTKPFGDATIVAVIVLVFFFAANMAIDAPSRSSSIPVIVGQEHMANALALNNVAQQLTFPAILPLTGVLTGTIGPAAVVAISLGAWVVILPLISLLRYSSVAEARSRASRGVFRDIGDGVRYASRDVTILAVLGMVVVLQVVAMPGVGMLGPVWMTDVLGLSRTSFGFIAMLWGMGALTSSLVFAAYNGMARRGLTLVAMVVLFSLGAIVFGHSRSVALTAVANFALGFALTGAIVTAITLVQYTVKDEMRGRVMGLFPLVMGLSMINVAPVGAASQAWSLEILVPSLGWAALALAAVIAVAVPGLRRARPGVELVPPIAGEAPRADLAAGA